MLREKTYPNNGHVIVSCYSITLTYGNVEEVRTHRKRTCLSKKNLNTMCFACAWQSGRAKRYKVPEGHGAATPQWLLNFWPHVHKKEGRPHLVCVSVKGDVCLHSYLQPNEYTNSLNLLYLSPLALKWLV